MFQHRYRYFFIFILSVYTLANTLICNVYYHFNITIPWYYSFLTILLVTLLTWEGNRLIEAIRRKEFNRQDVTFKSIVIRYLLGNIAAMLAAFAGVWLTGAVIHNYGWSHLINPLKLNIIYAGLINLLFHLLYAIIYLFNEYRQKRDEAEELRRISTQAELQLVRSQINPHFLFNNLNVLSAMLINDNPDANKFIEEFARVYRYILKNQEKELIELQTELEFIEPYIYLLKKRFTDGLNVSVNIPERYKTRQLVPASLQMLVENAIKHNVVSTARPLYICIHANGEDALVVTNNLQPKTVIEASTSIGLENIHKRYKLISRRTIAVRKTETSFEVVLPLLQIN